MTAKAERAGSRKACDVMALGSASMYILYFQNTTQCNVLIVFSFCHFFMCSNPEGKACPAAPALEEWRVCNDHPCVVFYWQASAWGPCLVNTLTDNGTSLWNETSTCAVGVQSRKVSCMKMNAGPVVSKRYAGGFKILCTLNALYRVLQLSTCFLFVCSLQTVVSTNPPRYTHVFPSLPALLFFFFQ